MLLWMHVWVHLSVCVCSVYFLPFTFLVIHSFLLGFSNWKWAMFWPIASSFRTKTFNFKLLEFSLFGLYFMAFAINQPLRTMFFPLSLSLSLSLIHHRQTLSVARESKPSPMWIIHDVQCPLSFPIVLNIRLFFVPLNQCTDFHLNVWIFNVTSPLKLMI